MCEPVSAASTAITCAGTGEALARLECHDERRWKKGGWQHRGKRIEVAVTLRPDAQSGRPKTPPPLPLPRDHRCHAIIGVAVVAACVGGIWWWWRQSAEAQPVTSAATEPEPDPSSAAPAVSAQQGGASHTATGHGDEGGLLGGGSGGAGGGAGGGRDPPGPPRGPPQGNGTAGTRTEEDLDEEETDDDDDRENSYYDLHEERWIRLPPLPVQPPPQPVQPPPQPVQPPVQPPQPVVQPPQPVHGGVITAWFTPANGQTQCFMQYEGDTCPYPVGANTTVTHNGNTYVVQNVGVRDGDWPVPNDDGEWVGDGQNVCVLELQPGIQPPQVEAGGQVVYWTAPDDGPPQFVVSFDGVCPYPVGANTTVTYNGNTYVVQNVELRDGVWQHGICVLEVQPGIQPPQVLQLHPVIQPPQVVYWTAPNNGPPQFVVAFHGPCPSPDSTDTAIGNHTVQNVEVLAGWHDGRNVCVMAVTPLTTALDAFALGDVSD